MSQIKKDSTMIQDDSDAAMREAHKAGRINNFEMVNVTRKFGDEEIEVTYRKQPLSAGFVSCYYAPLEPGTSIVNGLIYERDVEVTLRDGRTMYCDIYRPQGMTDIPVIIAWTPFGKRHYYGAKEAPALHQAMGVPKEAISMMGAFEGPDPSYWCSQGYAVANAEVPGTGNSQSDLFMFTEKGGQDGYDFIEWLGTQKWCNGKAGMAGNSGLAMAQWWIAAEQPPHLACIAPWEGTGDMYRESAAPGGIPHPIFSGMIFGDIRGNGLIEDLPAMIHKYPLMNGYWEDKIAKVNKINIPTYMAAGFSHPFHLRAAVANFRKIKTKKKWTRLHREFEWPDFNDPKYIADLKLFFDRYLKDIHNGWELTPPVRLQVMDAYDFDYQTDRPEKEFPLARTKYTKYYLNASDASLNENPLSNEAKTSYDANTGEVVFDIHFEEETELTGYFKLHLWVEADASDDMDLFVAVQKLDVKGKFIPTSVFGEPDPGAPGKLRVSHRALDEKLSTDYQPVQSHRKEELLAPGEIVPVDIEIWPTSRIWHKGEYLRVSVAGRYIRDKEWFLPSDFVGRNNGNHIIHTGGKYDSFLQAPVVPPKYQVGDYILR
ncbi:CocE/NonD family hydrolase [Desulfosporosinus fructosivorans]